MITSKSNDLIKYCIQIKEKKYSRKNGVCLVESIKLVKELLNKNLVTTILVTEDKYHNFRDLCSVKVEIISQSIVKLISDSTTSDGVFAIVKIPSVKNDNYHRCLILDRIQDPSNIGAIIRSACAFGYNTIFSVNSVYPYSFKAIRSSMGQVFNVDIVDVSFEELLKFKNNLDIDFIVADMDGDDIANCDIDPNRNIGIVIGNEGQGVDTRLIDISDKKVSIPMQNNVESLNASVSAGIIMYILK